MTAVDPVHYPVWMLQVASEINYLWWRHLTHGEDPPDCSTIAEIIQRLQPQVP